MSVPGRMLSVLAAVGLWAFAAHGQSPAFIDASERIGELYAEGRFREALPVAREALRLVEIEFGPNYPDVAEILTDVGRLYHAQRRFIEADQLAARARAIRAKHAGQD